MRGDPFPRTSRIATIAEVPYVAAATCTPGGQAAACSMMSVPGGKDSQIASVRPLARCSTCTRIDPTTGQGTSGVLRIPKATDLRHIPPVCSSYLRMRGGRVGKRSRRKAERRIERRGPLYDYLSPFETSSVLAVLEAASVSPTASHRITSLASMFSSAIHLSTDATKAMAPEDLQKVVKLAEAMVPSQSLVDDFLPLDVRHRAVARWGDDVFLIAPGGLERPLTLIDRAALLASAVDGHLTSEIGFGVSDAVELILRRIDVVVRSLEIHWPADAVPELLSSPVVSSHEISAARQVKELGLIIDECTEPARAQLALSRYSAKPKDVRVDWGHPAWLFDGLVAVRWGRGQIPLPAGLLIESVGAVSADLARIAAKSDDSKVMYRARAANRLGRLMIGSGRVVAGPIRTERGTIHSVMQFNDRQFLAIELVAELSARDTASRLPSANSALDAIRPGATLQTENETLTLPDDAQVESLVVIAPGEYIGSARSKHQVLPLEDVERILSETHEEPDALWYFVRDLKSPNTSHQFSTDMIDRWEVWKEQRSFHRGGVPVAMFFAPHTATAEWEDAAAHRDTERALSKLGLPPTRDWPVVGPPREERVELGDLASKISIDILPWDFPIAVEKLDPGTSDDHFEPRWKMSECVVHKLGQMKTALIQLFGGVADSLSIGFLFVDRADGPVLTAKYPFAGRVEIEWDGRLQELIESDTSHFEAILGALISKALANPATEEFVSAWSSTTPGIRVDAYSVPQTAISLPKPIDPSEPIRNEILPRLGRHLQSHGLEPQTLLGKAATDLESKVIFPWLLQQLWAAAEEIDRQELLRFALIQLECANSARYMEDLKLGWQAGFPSEEPVTDNRLTYVIRLRSISVIVEELVAAPESGGDVSLGKIDWIRILTTAHECFESCTRSDEMHFGLQPMDLEISELYEIRTTSSQEPPIIDAAAYSMERAKLSAPDAIPITPNPGGSAHQEDETSAAKRVVDLFPELEEVDNAMMATMDFDLNAIFAVLGTVERWPVENAEPIALVDVAELVGGIKRNGSSSTSSALRNAIAWLTLTEEGLTRDGAIKHWENERRADRVGIKPLVANGDGRIWLLPWTAGATLRVLLNYLQDGRLPWPMSVLPKDVQASLKQYFQLRNRELEQQCVEVLQSKFVHVFGSLKPARARKLGIADLPGEIDVLLVDPARSRIWVVEAKDPYTAYSIRQIRKRVDDFHRGDDCYNSKLDKKVAAVERSTGSLAEKLSINDPNRIWDVQGLVVTRNLNPAAFHPDAQFPFCRINQLLEIVDSDSRPAAGAFDSQKPVSAADQIPRYEHEI